MDEPGLSKIPGLSKLPKALGSSDLFNKKANPPEDDKCHRSRRRSRRTRRRRGGHRRRRRRSTGDDHTPNSVIERGRRADDSRRDEREESFRENRPGLDFQLGATSGVIAAGAWGARLEIASMIEAGCSNEQLLRMIRMGEESTTPLHLISPHRGGCPSEKVYPREGSYSPGPIASTRRSRTRSVAKLPVETPREEPQEDEVKPTFRRRRWEFG